MENNVRYNCKKIINVLLISGLCSWNRQRERERGGRGGGERERGEGEGEETGRERLIGR